ncbi:hypothetical protein SAMN04487900_11119 [Prevotella communis]|uniref:Uncharacterized protein n=2 Tax=Prevotella communis TaxID=2913614 RepID=A0A1H0HBQ5_9BACT|nr:hypothetical protein SAMN04487900_11119 [Prevotella communis]
MYCLKEVTVHKSMQESLHTTSWTAQSRYSVENAFWSVFRFNWIEKVKQRQHDYCRCYTQY